MKRRFHDAAQSVVSGSRVIAALWHFLWALVFAALAIWLFLSFGNWFAWSVAILLGLHGAYLVVQSSEAYLSASPAKRPDELERYLRSRSLYMPRDRNRGAEQKRPGQHE